MWNIKVNKRINQIVKVFHLFGIWRLENEANRYRRSRMALQSLFLCMLWSFAVLLIQSAILSDLKYESLFLIMLAIVASVTSVKLIYFILNQREIESLVDNIGTHSVFDFKDFKKINEKVKNLMKLSLSFFCCIFVTCVVVIISHLPIFSSEKRLPFNIRFPLDWKKNTIVYWIAYAFASISIMIGNISTLANIIIWYLMMNCAIKYRILGKQLINVFIKTSKIEMEKLLLKELIVVIKTHQNITSTIDRFMSCFTNLFFMQITTSGIGICASVHALALGTKRDTLMECAVYASTLLYNVFDIFIVIYFGNEITLSSDRLSYCLFKTNWLDQSKTCKKTLIILAEVLKRPKELVVGKVYPLNMKTFTSIVNAAYSLLNILKKLN